MYKEPIVQNMGNDLNIIDFILYLILSIKNNITSDTNDVHKNYINTVIKELELKINATKYLLESIDYYEKNQNSSGNEHSSHANQLMRESIDFQNVRNNLVKENPNLFK